MKRTNHAAPAPSILTDETIKTIDGDLLDRVVGVTQEQRHSLEEVRYMANAASKSNFYGLTEAQAFVLMELCQAEGLHPIQAVRRFDIIDGKPALKAAAMQADFLRRGGRIHWLERTSAVCSATFAHPVYQPDPLLVTVTLAELKENGVAIAKEGGLKRNYKRHPRSMLHARVISEGVRAVDPQIVVGLYTPEEVSDFDAPPPRSLPQIEPQPIATPPAPQPKVKSECYAWIEQQVQAANDHWSSTLFIESKTSQYKPICKNAWQCINGVVSQWIETGELNEDAVTTDGKRDREKIKALLANEWEQPDSAIKMDVEGYLDAKLREAAAAAGVNLDSEPATVTEAP